MGHPVGQDIQGGLQPFLGAAWGSHGTECRREPYGQQVGADERVGQPTAQTYPQLSTCTLAGFDSCCRLRAAGIVRSLLGLCSLGGFGQSPDPFLTLVGLGRGLGELLLGLLASPVADRRGGQYGRGVADGGAVPGERLPCLLVVGDPDLKDVALVRGEEGFLGSEPLFDGETESPQLSSPRSTSRSTTTAPSACRRWRSSALTRVVSRASPVSVAEMDSSSSSERASALSLASCRSVSRVSKRRVVLCPRSSRRSSISDSFDVRLDRA